jgi:hypothetical protein
MAENRLLGVAKIEIGAIAVDGDVATVFASPGVIYKDTAEIMQEQEADTEHYCEEQDEAFAIVPGAKKTKIKFAVTDFTPAALVALLGGTATGVAPADSWTAPATTDIIEKSIKITPKSGKVITFPRVALRAIINYKLAKSGIAQVVVEGTVMTPTKTGVAAIKIG